MKQHIRDIENDILDQYINDKSSRPWILAFSGGKDSTMLLQLVWNSVKKLSPSSRHRPISVVCNNTLVENPKILRFVEHQLELIKIAAPPEKIWSFLVEPEKVLRWSNFNKLEYTSEQRSGPGTLIYVEEKASPMPLMKVSFTITEWIENEKLASKMNSGPRFLKECEAKWMIEAIPSGSRVTYIEIVEFPLGIIGKLFGLIGQRSADTNTSKTLSRLKSLVKT